MKILIVYSDLKCSCTKKCTFELSIGLNFYTQTDTLFYLDLSENSFKEYNVIIFQRLGANGAIISSNYFSQLEKLISKYKGITTTSYLLDDLILNPESIRMIKNVDKVIVPNQSYFEHISKYNNNISCIRTFIDLEEILKIKPKKLPDTINLLWASTGGLGLNFMRELIPGILEKIPEASIYIIGSIPYLKEFKNIKNIKCLPILPYEEFIKYYKSCDICLNPISSDAEYFRNVKNTDFINCKSELKYIISGASRIPIISSKSHPYEYAIKNGVNGFILDNDKNSWISHIILLLQNKEIKDSIVQAAFKDVSINYTLKAVGEKVYKIFTRKNTELSKEYKVDINNPEGNSTLGEIYGNKKILQSFTCQSCNLFRVDLKVATYKRKNSGILRISVKESLESKKDIHVENIFCEEIEDNSWVSFSFPPIPDSCGKNYLILIEGSGCSIGKSVTLYYNPNTKYGSLYINKVKFNGSLVLKTFTRI